MNVSTALMVANRAHSGQFDKGGQPYIRHPMRVSAAMHSDDERIVALLHDVVEDSDITLGDLRRDGFSDAVVDAVDALTRRRHEVYSAYILRVAANPLAVAVKVADLADNMDLSRIPNPQPRDYARLGKYGEALRVLMRDY